MEKSSLKITLDQYYGIFDIKKKNGSVYVYLRYRNKKIKQQVSLPSNFYTLSKASQQKSYRGAKEILDTKLGLSKSENKDMRKVSLLTLIDKYLSDFYDNNVKDDINRQVTFDSTSITVRHRIERHTLSNCSVEELVENDNYMKEYFKESREGFYCKEEKKEIKPISKSSINKEVQLLMNTFKFIKFEKKWIASDDYETLIYQIEKYRNVGTYSKSIKNNILSAYEFILFKKEILERKDTDVTYMELLKNELDKNSLSQNEKDYILYLSSLERKRINLKSKSYPEPQNGDIDLNHLIEIYQKIENKVKEHIEQGFMIDQPDLHYPVIRYYRQEDNSFSSENVENKKYADIYVINKKSKSDSGLPYYYCDGSLNALFLLFNVNTGMRYNENRSLKVGAIKQRVIHISTDEHINSYYLELKEQVQSVIERDEEGNALVDEDNRLRKRKIITDPKTNSSVREIPLNDTAIRVLQILQEITGTEIFNEDGSLCESHKERYIFVNYKKHENTNGKNMGREGVFLEDFKTYLTYERLKNLDVNDDILKYRMRDIDDVENTRAYYLQQILDIKKRIDDGEEFIWNKQVYVIKPPALPSNSNVNKTLKRILSNMRVENFNDFSVHDLRRTTSSLMSQNGHKTLDIQHILGHAENSSVTEDVYIKTNYLPALQALQELDSI